MLTSKSGRMTFANEVQSEKAEEETVTIESEKLTSTSESQFENALEPMLLTPSGMATDVSAVLENAPSATALNDRGRDSAVRRSHPEKAYAPMVDTLFPIVTVVRESADEKARTPIERTPSGMVTDSTAEFSKALLEIAVSELERRTVTKLEQRSNASVPMEVTESGRVIATSPDE